MSLAPGTPVKLLVDAPGSVKDGSLLMKSGNTVLISSQSPVPTRATPSCGQFLGPSYALRASMGTQIVHAAVPLTDPRAVNNNALVCHYDLAPRPGAPPKNDGLYTRREIMFLLKPYKFEARNPGNPKVEFKVGEPVFLFSDAMTHSGGSKLTLAGVKPYYQIQPTRVTREPQVWNSHLYYPVEGNTFVVL